MRILNCRLTKSDATVLETFGRRPDGTWHTGCEIGCDDVYSLCNGVVLAIHNELRTKVVTIQYDRDVILRYGNLSSTTLDVGALVEDGQLVGHAHKSVHFEFCTRSNIDTRFPVRIGSQTYFKSDPIDYVTDNIVLYSTFKRMNKQRPREMVECR